MHAPLGAVAIPPRLFGREREDRRQPRCDTAEDLVDHRQRRAALQARIGFAVERVLADVEVERGEVGVHERRQRRDHAAEVVGGIGGANLGVELGEPVQDEALQLRQLGARHRELGRIVVQRAQHPAQRVPELAVGFGGGLHDGGAEADVVRDVGGGDPEAQDVGAGGLHHLLRREHVALRLRHLLIPLLVEDEAMREYDVVGRAAARAAAFSSSEDWNQPRCWSEPSRYMTLSGPPS